MKQFIFATIIMLFISLVSGKVFAKTKESNSIIIKKNNNVSTIDQTEYPIEYPKVENSDGIVGFKLGDVLDTKFSAMGNCEIYKSGDVKSIVFNFYQSAGNTGISVTRSIVLDSSLNNVTLRDILGDNYESIVYDYVKKQIESNKLKGDSGYLYGDKTIKYDVLKEAIKSQRFAYYIYDGMLVFIFDKYSLANSCMEFKMKIKKDKIKTVDGREIIFKNKKNNFK